MRLVSNEIADLAQRACALRDYPWLSAHLGPLEETLEVLADWLEEGGDPDLASFFRPCPKNTGMPESQWRDNRDWTLRAIVEAHEKRDAIAELERRRAAAPPQSSTGTED